MYITEETQIVLVITLQSLAYVPVNEHTCTSIITRYLKSILFLIFLHVSKESGTLVGIIEPMVHG